MIREKQKVVLLFGIGICLSLYWSYYAIASSVSQIGNQCHDIIPSVKYVDQDSVELWKELTELQHPTSCRDQKALVYPPKNAGLGSELHWLTVALSVAYRERRTLVLNSTWVYGDCANKDLSCYFVSQGCAMRDIPPISGSSLYTDDQVISPKINIVQEAEYIPHKYKHRGQLWWRSQLVAFLLTGTKDTKEMINRQRVVIPKPYTSVHIRQGDACTNVIFGHSCLPISKYMEAIRERGLPKTLFISTDSQKVVDELAPYASEFKMYFANEYRSEESVAIELKLSVAKANTTFVTVSLLTSLELMSDGNAFVGTFASNIGRVVYELMYYKKSGVVNFVSLDMPYFFMPGIPVKNVTRILNERIEQRR